MRVMRGACDSCAAAGALARTLDARMNVAKHMRMETSTHGRTKVLRYRYARHMHAIAPHAHGKIPLP